MKVSVEFERVQIFVTQIEVESLDQVDTVLAELVGDQGIMTFHCGNDCLAITNVVEVETV